MFFIFRVCFGKLHFGCKFDRFAKSVEKNALNREPEKNEE